ncbi:MAG: rod shape-determining protein RodA [Siphonobacter sp.]
MASRENSILNRLDWLTVALYLACVLTGWLNIYAAVYNPDAPISIFNFDTNSGKQLVFLGFSVLIIIAILVIDYRFWETFAIYIYGFVLLLLVAVLFLGADIKGSHSWFRIGPIGFQPSEIAKTATLLVIAKYVSTPGINLTKFKDQANVAIFMIIPIILILLSKETGQTLVFAGFMLMLYREGLPGFFPLIIIVSASLFVLALTVDALYIALALAVIAGLVILFLPRYQRNKKTFTSIALIYVACMGMVLASDFIVNHILEPHQRARIEVLIDPNSHKRGKGWNVIQSKIAIGSGGIFGKGFLQGTQTKFDFVPEQSTDFIFCTVGEEHGFFGSLVVVGLFTALILRLVFLAERQRIKFARVYGYGVVSVFFFHFLVNIGMTIGLMPVIGIPLPFFSYGGSGLWSFTILLFIFLKLDAQRSLIMSRI